MSNTSFGEIQSSPPRLALWWRACRPFSFPASLTPILLGASLVAGDPFDLGVHGDWKLLPLILFSSLMLHGATNMSNDYYDFRNGVDDRESKGCSGILTEGLMSPDELFRGAKVLFGLASLLGFGIYWFRGWPILMLGALGIFGGYFYTADPLGYKYMALGELFVFLLMGPLMVSGTFYALSGTFDWPVLMVSLPIGSLVAAILSANNYRDRVRDVKKGAKTLANLLSPHGARLLYLALLLSAYLWVLLLLGMELLPLSSLLVLLSLPLALDNGLSLGDESTQGSLALESLDARTAKLHLVFGVLLSFSFFL